MARYVIQNTVTGEFLCFRAQAKSVGWSAFLAAAILNGVTTDEEEVQQLIDDYCDRGCYTVIDLDACR
jgi:hypothetical protein